MSRILLLRVVNLILLAAITVQIVTGLGMFFALDLPGGPVAHRFNALLVTSLIAVHIWLNRLWIQANLFMK